MYGPVTRSNQKMAAHCLCLVQGLNAEGYCGFNLLVGDLQLQQVAYVSNRDKEGPKVLPPGAYGEYLEIPCN